MRLQLGLEVRVRRKYAIPRVNQRTRQVVAQCLGAAAVATMQRSCDFNAVIQMLL